MIHPNWAFVISTFNVHIVNRLWQGAERRLQELDIQVQEQDIWRVPGAIEIPFAAQYCAKRCVYDAIVCLGAVVRGETGHYDCVCQQVSYGCQRVALDCGIPIIFGVLTTDTEQQALERSDESRNKGREAVDAAWCMFHRFFDLVISNQPSN